MKIHAILCLFTHALSAYTKYIILAIEKDVICCIGKNVQDRVFFLY